MRKIKKKLGGNGGGIVILEGEALLRRDSVLCLGKGKDSSNPIASSESSKDGEFEKNFDGSGCSLHAGEGDAGVHKSETFLAKSLCRRLLLFRWFPL